MSVFLTWPNVGLKHAFLPEITNRKGELPAHSSVSSLSGNSRRCMSGDCQAARFQAIVRRSIIYDKFRSIWKCGCWVILQQHQTSCGELWTLSGESRPIQAPEGVLAWWTMKCWKHAYGKCFLGSPSMCSAMWDAKASRPQVLQIVSALLHHLELARPTETVQLVWPLS